MNKKLKPIYWDTIFIDLEFYIKHTEMEFFRWDEKFISQFFTFTTDYIYIPKK